MTVSNFEILLTNSNNSYFAGQTVSGQVVVDVQDRPKVIHGMFISYLSFVKKHSFLEITSE